MTKPAFAHRRILSLALIASLAISIGLAVTKTPIGDEGLLALISNGLVQRGVLGLDNLERAIKHAPKDLADNDYVKGVQSVAKQFEQCLTQLGVERIKTVGEHFDPKLHEAVHMEDGGGHSLDSEEIISEELQSGYKIGDDVIRHAMVKVKMEKK